MIYMILLYFSDLREALLLHITQTTGRMLMIDTIKAGMIWQVVDSRKFGGIESHILYLSKALQDAGRSVCVVFINDFGMHPLESFLTGHRIRYLKCQGVVDFVQSVGTHKPSLMHGHGY